MNRYFKHFRIKERIPEILLKVVLAVIIIAAFISLVTFICEKN